MQGGLEQQMDVDNDHFFFQVLFPTCALLTLVVPDYITSLIYSLFFDIWTDTYDVNPITNKHCNIGTQNIELMIAETQQDYTVQTGTQPLRASFFPNKVNLYVLLLAISNSNTHSFMMCLEMQVLQSADIYITGQACITSVMDARTKKKKKMNEAADMAGWEVTRTEHSPAANLH